MNARIRALSAATAVLLGLSFAGCGNTAGETKAGDKPSAAGGNNIVITYNSPKEWGNYGEVLSKFTAESGINAPNDPKNSGQTLAALQAEKSAPVADVAYVGIAFAPQLVAAGVLQPYTPKGSESVEANLKSKDQMWTTVHTGTIALLVNKEHLGGAPVPTSWADLLKPEYKGKVGYLDPNQAAIGYSVVTAVNEALGGNLDNWKPGLDYMKKLKDNGAIISAQTATAKVAQGEIPILIDTDFNGYKLRDTGSKVDIVIPTEGSLKVPYVVALVKGAPHAENGKKLLDYYYSTSGQQSFAKGYMMPVAGDLPADLKSKVLPASDYARAKTVDYIKQGDVQKEFLKQYQAEVGK